LLAGTRNAAQMLDMDDDIGTLEAGKLADILVVDGDPLTDITVLQDKRRLKLIMQDGKVIDTTSRLPEPEIYSWEKPQTFWPVDQVLSQEFVRKKAKNKPAWMTAKLGKAASSGASGRTRAA